MELPAPTADRPRPLLELFPPIAERRPEVFSGPAAADSPPAVAPAASSKKPFTLSTEPRFVYRSASFDRASQQLVAALGRGDRLMVLTGEFGVGRTTLCRSLVEQLGRRGTTCFVTPPVASFAELMTATLTLTGANGGASAAAGPEQVAPLVIIDDAHNVAADVLAPLAAIAAGDQRMQLLLVGTPALTSLLAQPDLQPLRRAVSVWCRLEPLLAEETAGYVAHRLAIAGAGSSVTFDAAACVELHAVTGGMPRQINLVCDRVLSANSAASAKIIGEELITSAASDLDLIAVEPEIGGALRKAVVALVVVGSLLAGAGVAAWVFRSDLTRLLASWRP